MINERKIKKYKLFKNLLTLSEESPTFMTLLYNMMAYQKYMVSLIFIEHLVCSYK